MNEKLMAFNRIVKEAKCVMIYEQEIPSELLELYNHMIDIAIKQNAFFENRSGFYNYEKMYLQSEGLLFCWQKVFAENPFYMFDICSGTNYNIVRYEEQAE